MLSEFIHHFFVSINYIFNEQGCNDFSILIMERVLLSTCKRKTLLLDYFKVCHPPYHIYRLSWAQTEY